ncbi:putative porin [Flavobacterium terrae]|uniref:Putative porin n=1 Tax=Flavobacterium terrae TaxID=415425 RepID=A0A1M6DI56_9FLAO|nr:putative porin [Flavobacterium terrae]SHI72862.1 Putative porin [Flavobacterium terrae]
MRLSLIVIVFFVFSWSSVSAQRNPLRRASGGIDNTSLIDKDTTKAKSLREAPKEAPKAKHNQYRIISLNKDTVYVDTSLTIKKEYAFNYLRRDNFGLLPFANDGHTYNTLDFGISSSTTSLPNFGFKGKHFNYLNANDIKYFSVATPLTELYFKTVLEQGQNLDAFITLNTSENLNFSIAYKGLRSLGKYINNLSSSGNFRFTTSYSTSNRRYIANLHYTSQDMLNKENDGIIDIDNFESGNSEFTDRSRLEVNLSDASSMLKGKRYFIDHSFRINKNDNANNVLLDHQFSYETKYFEFKMPTKTERYGSSFVNSNYNDLTKSNVMYNKLGATFSNSLIGKFNFFIEDFKYNYFYDRYIVSGNQILIPNTNNNDLNAVGGKYFYNKNKIYGYALFSKAISKQTFSTLDLSVKYKFNDKNYFSAQYLNLSKVPDMNYTLYQSDFVNYNWKHSFNNEKINTLKIDATTQWGSAQAQISTLTDHLYFSDDSLSSDEILVTPKQYNSTIGYFSLKVEKEFKFRKFALDNTVLYQQVTQNDPILNVPKITTRNTLYFSDYLFKKAMFLQTGFTFQYFTGYYANAYNPLIAEFYTQNSKKIGNFPLIDFFVNARVQQCRIFLKAEHFNSSFTGRDYYAAPNNPYKDFVIRFGLVWNFFQ